MSGRQKPTAPHVLAAIEAGQAKLATPEKRPLADHVQRVVTHSLQSKEIAPGTGKARHVEAAIRRDTSPQVTQANSRLPQTSPEAPLNTPTSSLQSKGAIDSPTVRAAHVEVSMRKNLRPDQAAFQPISGRNGPVLQQMENVPAGMAPERKRFIKRLLRERMKDYAYAGTGRGYIDRPYAEEMTYGIRDMGAHRETWRQQMDTVDQLLLLDPTLQVARLSFDDWFREKSQDGSLGPIKKVQYLGAAERQNYLIRIEQGRLYRGLELFDTSALKTDHMGVGWAIFVLSPVGEIYSGSHIAEEFHHSSFLAGGRVGSAGEWQVEKGIVRKINDKSGHYKPSDSMVFRMLKHLDSRGVSLSNVGASFRSYGTYGEVLASDVLLDSGRGPQQGRSYGAAVADDPKAKKDKCFLTTACVSSFGLPDDCYELETLRGFRDGYLRRFSEGQALISEYYRIAPGLVRSIDSEIAAPLIYFKIYQIVLECVFDIESGENERALVRYAHMVHSLNLVYSKNAERFAPPRSPS